jgi:hypothetical protein
MFMEEEIGALVHLKRALKGYNSSSTQNSLGDHLHGLPYDALPHTISSKLQLPVFQRPEMSAVTIPYNVANNSMRNYNSSSVELELGHQTRFKIACEAISKDPDLRRMVGLCNTLDTYSLRLQLQHSSMSSLKDELREGETWKGQRNKDVEDYAKEDMLPSSRKDYNDIQVRAVEFEEEDDESDGDGDSDSDYDSDGISDNDSISDNDDGCLHDYEDGREEDYWSEEAAQNTTSVVSRENGSWSSGREVNKKLHTFLKSMKCRNVSRNF